MVFDIPFLASRLKNTIDWCSGHTATEKLQIGLNRHAMKQITYKTHLEIVLRATHLFDEPGTLDTVIEFARDWFQSPQSEEAAE
jgi:hypothetical protein